MNKFKHALFNNKTEDKRTLQFLKLQNQAPFIGLTDLTEKEKPVYASWWKDLDPFDLDLISNEKILNFLKRCCLEDIKLEQILLLFETARDGLNKAQFFAMLRLIAHAQNGRNISRALIYLGAPVPKLQSTAVHQEQKSLDAIFTINKSDTGFMNKWWDQSSTTTLHSPQVGNWCENQSIETNSRIRSRSATTPEPAAIQQDVLPSSFSLYNLTERDHGQSLLLTKAFVYQSPSTRNKELHRRQQEQYNNSSELVNPFQSPSDDSEDDDDSDKLDSPFADDYYTTNNKPNSYMIPPPPVPTQLTKPAFLKYTRNSFPKRSQSTKEIKKKKQVYQHQRHKSISSNYYFK